MKRRLNIADRLAVGVTGLVLTAVGVIALLRWVGVQPVVDAVGDVDNDQISSAPDQSWWHWALLVATIVLGIAGLWLLLANIRPNRLRTVTVRPTEPFVGDVDISVPDVGRAAARSLERHRHVESTSIRSYVDGVTPVLEFTVTAAPTSDDGDLLTVVRAVRELLLASFAGSDVRLRMLLHRAPNH
jgi:hypothetical protein